MSKVNSCFVTYKTYGGRKVTKVNINVDAIRKKKKRKPPTT